MSHSVTIKAQFIREIPEDNVYRVKVDIIDVTNIDFDVLVFTVEDGVFSHVATVYDLETYPAGQAAADAANVAFFRDRGVIANFSNVRDATGFETVTANRLKILAVSWGSVGDAFVGSEIITVDNTSTS